jgi:hypothetical protein
MRQILAIFLAVSAGLFACESPTESSKIRGLNLPLGLSLAPGTLDSISFRLVEGADRPCGNYQLRVSASSEGDALRFDVKNYVIKPTACYTAEAPGHSTHSISFGPGTEGTYELSIHLGKQTDTYQLVVEEGSCWLSGEDGQISRIERDPVARNPGT